MTRWTKGEAIIERLLADGHLQQVPADADTANALLETSQRHLGSAEQTSNDDPEGALSLAYDAARKAATALLAHQGLRPTTAGGHIAVVEAVSAQFTDVPGLRSLDRLRRRRNQGEYPDPARYDAITCPEAREAVETARTAMSSVARLLDLPQLGVF